MIEKNKKNLTKYSVLMSVGALLLMMIFTFASPGVENRAWAADQDRTASQKAFIEASEVLFHPRCINCHPSGDAPMITDNSQTHLFNVKRGAEGKGVGGMSCTLCHRDTNQPDGPPGVPNWHMPPKHMPMIFQGRTAGNLCRQLKDPKHNGGKTGTQIIDHLGSDPLVLWGWNPGKGRMSPKMDHKTFTAKMREWVNKGAYCPE